MSTNNKYNAPVRNFLRPTGFNLNMNIKLHKNSCIFLNTEDTNKRVVTWYNPNNPNNQSTIELLNPHGILPSYFGYELFLAIMHQIVQNHTPKIADERLKNHDLVVRQKYSKLIGTTNYNISLKTAKSRVLPELQSFVNTKLYMNDSNYPEEIRFIKNYNLYPGEVEIELNEDVRYLYLNQYRKLFNLKENHKCKAKKNKATVLAMLAYVQCAMTHIKIDSQKLTVTSDQLYENFNLKNPKMSEAVNRLIKSVNPYLQKLKIKDTHGWYFEKTGENFRGRQRINLYELKLDNHYAVKSKFTT